MQVLLSRKALNEWLKDPLPHLPLKVYVHPTSRAFELALTIDKSLA